ncbi:hypothetical protein D3C78_884240 [compost metagenome]
MQALGERLTVVGQDVQGEMVGCVLGQLCLPGVEQLGAQQGDQGHGQQDQAKRQCLARGSHGVAQQLAQAQAPGQRGACQQLPQAT